jgi:hypothetical protein
MPALFFYFSTQLSAFCFIKRNQAQFGGGGGGGGGGPGWWWGSCEFAVG